MGSMMQPNTSNSEILHFLFHNKKINLNRGKIFDYETEPIPSDFDFDRVEGMMLGLAIGDSLGFPTESKRPQQRIEEYGEITDYPKTGVRTSDDTQMAFWTLEQMIEDGEFLPENVAHKFCYSGRIIGQGQTVAKFIANYKKKGLLWYQCGPESAGNGALMRIAPMLIPHLKTGGSKLWIDTALSAMMTHNDSSSIAACISFVNMLWQLLQMKEPPKSKWWLETFVDIAADLECNDTYQPRGGEFLEYKGNICDFINERIPAAHTKKQSALDACNSWYSGAYLLETIPSAIYILTKHGDDPEQAIIRAVNDTKDNDTIAAIVGAAVGALYGRKRLPARWVAQLERTKPEIPKTLDDAKLLWFE